MDLSERTSKWLWRYRLRIPKRRITLYKGDLVIRELYLKQLIAELQELEDIYFTYRRAQGDKI